jgi:hypothetical protein
MLTYADAFSAGLRCARRTRAAAGTKVLVASTKAPKYLRALLVQKYQILTASGRLRQGARSLGL